MSRPELSDGQRRVLEYMIDFFNDNDQLPPQPYIQRAFGWSSPNAVTQIVKALAKKGFITKNETGKYKFLPKCRNSYPGLFG